MNPRSALLLLSLSLFACNPAPETAWAFAESAPPEPGRVCTDLAPGARASTRDGLPFDAEAFAAPAGLASGARWPSLTAFSTVHAATPEVHPVRLSRVDLTLTDPRGTLAGGTLEGVWLLAEPHSVVGQSLHVIGESNAVTEQLRRAGPWTVSHGALTEPGEVVLTGYKTAEGARDVPVPELVVTIHTVTADTPPPARWWTGWVYTHALANEGPLATEARPLPMGSCSMDTAPRDAAAAHAAECLAEGDLSCFVQFQVMLMGDRFSRVAYSSMAARQNGTAAEALVKSGLDTSRLVTGLMLTFESAPETRVGSDPWRLGRFVAESGQVDLLAPLLEAMAEDASLDDYNRLRATWALWAMHADLAPEDGGRAPSQIASGKVRMLDLAPAAKAWVASM